MLRYKIIILSFLLFSFNIKIISNNKFFENKGQWNENVLYKLWLANGSFFLEKNTFTFFLFNKDSYRYDHNNALLSLESDIKLEELKLHAYKMIFLNSSINVKIYPEKPAKDYCNFYIGNDSQKWKSHIKGFYEINYENIYPNIDLKVYSTSMSNIKYDFKIKPYADLSKIQIKYDGIDTLYLDNNGNLKIKTSVGTNTELKPFAYQIINNIKIPVKCNFILKKNILSFKIASYNKNYTLIIDPVLIFATYSGSTADNFGMTATFDNEGNLFAGGMAFNIGYPTTTGAFDSTFNNTPASGITDVVITKYNKKGDSLIYSTYIGGNGTETVHSLIVNKNNELYLYGATSSSNFPVTVNAYDTSFNGGSYLYFVFNGTRFSNGTDIYVSKFNYDGSTLLGSTYIGGSNNDGVSYNISSNNYNSVTAYDSLTKNYGDQFRGEILTDDSGYCYIASVTRSNDFPVINAFQNSLAGQQDGIVLKLSPNLNSLIWSSYLGGYEKDAAYSIKIDANGNIFVTGGTSSTDFPVSSNVINTVYQGGKVDGYIVKINPSGDSILKSTFIGTPFYDQCYFIDIDRFNNIYVVGQSMGNMPVIPSTVYNNPNSKQFIMKINNSLDSIIYSTVFGNGNGQINISPTAFMVDACENVYVSGWGANILQSTPLSNMPLTSNAFQSTTDGFDFYLFVLKRNADTLLYATYIGGNQSKEHVDGGTSRFDNKGIVYESVCAGCGGHSDFPTTPGAWSNTNNSVNCNNAVFKFDFEIAPKADFLPSTIEGCAPLTVYFQNLSNNVLSYLWDFGNGDTSSTEYNPVRTYTDTGKYTVYLIVTDSICGLTDTAVKVITVHPKISLSVKKIDTLCTDSMNIIAYSNGTATKYIWSSNNNFTDTLNQNLNDSIFSISPTQSTKYYVLVDNGYCYKVDSVFVFKPASPIAAFSQDTSQGCLPLTVTFQNQSANYSSFIWYFGNGDSSIIMNPVYTFNDTGTYNVSLIAIDSICSKNNTITSTVKVYPLLKLNTQNDTVVCSDSVKLYAYSNGTALTYIWSDTSSFSDTLNSSLTDSIITIFLTSSSYYYVKASNNYCEKTDSIFVQKSLPPFSNFTSSFDTACAPVTITFQNQSSNYYSYLWDFGNGNIDSTNLNPVVTFNDSGNYNVKLIVYDSICGLSDTFVHNIIIYPKLQLIPPQDTTVCNDSVKLVLISYGSAISYLWSTNNNFSDTLNNTNDSTITLYIDSSKYFYIKVSNGYCNIFDSVYVNKRNVNAYLSSDNICKGDSTIISVLNSNPNDTLIYNWTFDSSILSSLNKSQITVNPDTSTTYYVQITNQFGCTLNDSIKVIVYNSPFNNYNDFVFSDNDTIFLGQSTILHSSITGNYLYQWWPANNLNNPSIQNPTAKPETTTTYYLLIEDTLTTCSITDSTKITVIEAVCGEPDIYVSNAFTPNGDNKNDKVFVHGKNISDLYFTIYNRWGEKVFETTKQSEGWDGYYKNKLSDPAVFVYYLKVKCFDGQEYFKKGNITLIR